MSVDDFDLVMRVHARQLVDHRAVARKWRDESKETGGKVYGRIITTSGAGLQGYFGQTNYSAAKAAIVGLTQTLSLELASTATVNAISPGGRTRMSATMAGAAAPIEPDERSEEEFDPKDPSLGSPVVVACEPGSRARQRPGQQGALGENIQWLKGWTPISVVSNGGKRWDASKLGGIMGIDVSTAAWVYVYGRIVAVSSTPRPPEGDWLGTPFLTLERRGPFAVVTVGSSDARNALSPAMYFGLRYAIAHCEADPDIHGLILTGTGDVFIPGGDLGTDRRR